MIRKVVTVVVLLLAVHAVPVEAQNCCAPAVPQQGMLGETVALPHTLEIGLHYQYFRSRGLRQGTDAVDDPSNTRATWQRVSVTMAYGILERLSATVIVPYWIKRKELDLACCPQGVRWTADGLGDVTLLARYSIIPRNFITFREVAVGVGIKVPTGSTEQTTSGFLLPEEYQPGTGSWDWTGSVSFYQGYETIDFFISASYTHNGTHEDYRFGHEFSWLASSNYHLHERIDLSLGLSGVQRGRDCKDGVDVDATGRTQILVVPGVQVQVVPQWLRAQVFVEAPVYQYFNGTQLGSDFNLRFSLTSLIPLFTEEDEE